MAWINSCALARLAMLASSILNRRAVKAKTPPAVQSTPVWRLQGSDGAVGGGGGGGGGLTTDEEETEANEEEEGSAAEVGRGRGRERVVAAGPEEVEHGGDVFNSSWERGLAPRGGRAELATPGHGESGEGGEGGLVG